MPFEPVAYPSPTPDQDVRRAEAARRLKSAQRSMVVSAVITVLLLAVTLGAFLNGRYTGADKAGRAPLLGVLAAIILLRFAFRGWRLYSTWHKLKEAQEDHRGLQ